MTLAGRQRLFLMLAAAGLAGLLVLAGSLQPDSRGLGTHEQLGLPPCTFRTLFGWRCPGCGMTTAWANFGHGDIVAAARASFSGTLLAGLALLAAVWLAMSAVGGKWLLWQPRESGVIGLAVLTAAVVLTEWGVRLWMG